MERSNDADMQSQVRLPHATVPPLKTAALGYTVRRRLIDEFYERRVSALPDGTNVLDLGGHTGAKRGFFDISRYDVRVVCANISTDKGTDVVADAAQVPFTDGVFDVVISAELLEHVRHPNVVLKESFRVLRSGGMLLATAPFLYRKHGDPGDFGRYTDAYWRGALGDCGFVDVEIESQGAFFSVLADYYKQYANNMKIVKPFGRLMRWVMAHLFVLRFEQWARRHERRSKVQSDPFLQSFTTGFGLLAKKP